GWALLNLLLLPQAHMVLEQLKSECRFYNRTQRVWCLFRHLCNLKEFMCFDSNMGEYLQVTELGWLEAKYRNNWKELLARKNVQLRGRPCFLWVFPH
uniref:MHC class II beta chain N-terminal domain-containing protein n=1 Tax=Mus spicilegus TaxID=10103 RepID=A0A8C6GVU5_MUSSI